MNTVPVSINQLDQTVTGGCCFTCLGMTFEFLAHEKHPLVAVRTIAKWDGTSYSSLGAILSEISR